MALILLLTVQLRTSENFGGLLCMTWSSEPGRAGLKNGLSELVLFEGYWGSPSLAERPFGGVLSLAFKYFLVSLSETQTGSHRVKCKACFQLTISAVTRLWRHICYQLIQTQPDDCCFLALRV